MQVGKLNIEFNEQAGSIEISFQNELILNKLSPILYYAEDWLSEETGEIVFNQISLDQKTGFESNLDFPEYYDLAKNYTVKSSTNEFSIIVHACIFPTHQAIYVWAEISGNEAKSDQIGGLIDCGVPQNISAYRFFHTGDKKLPFDNPNPSQNMAVNFFMSDQTPWEEPCYLDHLPNNDYLPITYMLGQTSVGFIAFVPICRFGQISVIRSCSFLEIPQGLKFLSGNYLENQQYAQLAGGLIGFGEDPLELSESIFRTYMQLVKRTQALRATKEYPQAYEYMGFCTWNTFYSSVDNQGVLDLAENNFTANSGSDRFRYLILDDGWQAITGQSIVGDIDTGEKTSPRALRHFESNSKFPNGLRNLSDTLK
jgi:hypothetical protein